MTSSEPDDTIRYVTDTLDLNMSLDAVNIGDNSERNARALIQGNERYFDLVFRRLFLEFQPKHTAIVLWMLDIIQARLSALERLRDQNLLNSGVQAAKRKPRHTALSA